MSHSSESHGTHDLNIAMEEARSDKPAREALIEKYALATKRNAREMEGMPITVVMQHFREFADEITALRTPAEEKPFAAMTIDHTGCEHMSRDVENIELIASGGAKGPTVVVYLFTTPPVDEAKVRVTDEMVMRAAHVFWTGANKDEVWLRSSPHATIRRALEAALSPAPAVDEKQGEER